MGIRVPNKSHGSYFQTPISNLTLIISPRRWIAEEEEENIDLENIKKSNALSSRMMQVRAA